MGQDHLSRMAEPRGRTRSRRNPYGKRNHRSASHAQSRAMACLSYTEQTGSAWWLFDPECMEAEEEEEAYPCG